MGLSAFLPDHNFRTEEHPGKLIDTRQNLQSIQPTFLETGILFYSTGALSTYSSPRAAAVLWQGTIV
jgi:hypothetical protein